MAEVFNVKKRETQGTKHSRRERAAGNIPAVLYGHGEGTISLLLSGTEVTMAIRHGTKVVDLKGDLSDSALINDVQWDAFGEDILHIDLTRVSKGETVETSVPIELWGESPGAKEGGIVDQQLHELEIECAVDQLPEKIEVNINQLNLNDSIVVSDLPLPAAAKPLVPLEMVVVQCVEPEMPEEEEEEGVVVETAEPELIGGREEEEEGSSEA